MRMAQRGEQPRLGGEPRFCPVASRRQNLDGHGTVQPAVPAGQHQPERALAEGPAQVVAGQRRGHPGPVDNHDVGAAPRWR